MRWNSLSAVFLVFVFAIFFAACQGAGDDDSASAANDDTASDDSADDSAGDDTAAEDAVNLPQWIRDRLYLQNRSLFKQDINMAAPWPVRRLGPIGIGNGKVFGIVGNQYPLGSWHNLGGPDYQKDLKWFSDKIPTARIGDERLAPARQTLSYVRQTPVVIAAAADGRLEWTSVNFAPRGADDPAAETALVSVWILRNVSGAPIAAAGLEIGGWMANFRDGALHETDLGSRRLTIRPLGVTASQGTTSNDMLIPFGDLEPGAERVVVVPMVFTMESDDPEPVFAAIDAGLDSLLESTVTWWQTWAAGLVRITTPNAKFNDLMDMLAMTIKVNQAASGSLTQMSQYSYTWLRDTHGPSLLFPLIGKLDDYKVMLDYLYGVSVINGGIDNALPVNADTSDLPPPPDWRNLPELTGRIRAESPSFLVLEYENYYKATGDLDTLSERYDMLWHALHHQAIVDGCLEYFSGDETFEDTMEATFGENIFNEPDESIVSSYSSFAFIRAARFMTQLATLLGKTDDADGFTQFADDFVTCLNDTFWMPDKGFWAVKAATATREPYPLPYEDVDTMPLWLDVFPADDPKIVQNFDSIKSLLGRDDGALASEVAPFYKKLFRMNSVQTGMSHGYWIVNLDKMFHPDADKAFRLWSEIVTPAGSTDEALNVDDYSHLSIVREGLGVVCDISARYRSWESGIFGHALLFHLTGYTYDLTAQTASLAPHLPPEWDHVNLAGLQYGDGRFDLEVRHAGGGRTITLTTDASTSFELTLAAPIEGAFDSATVGGTAASATAETNTYGRTVVRFAPFTVAAGTKTEIIINSH